MSYINKADLTNQREGQERSFGVCFCAFCGGVFVFCCCSFFSPCWWVCVLYCTACLEFYSALASPSPTAHYLSTSSPPFSVSMLTRMFAFGHWLVCFMIISVGVYWNFWIGISVGPDEARRSEARLGPGPIAHLGSPPTKTPPALRDWNSPCCGA